MFLETLEKLRKQPLAVRQQVMFLVTLVVAMLITIVWAAGLILGSTVFKPSADAAPTPPPGVLEE